MDPQIQYAKTEDGVNIAYLQAPGRKPHDHSEQLASGRLIGK